jgi:hypothetical protein
MTYRHFRNFSLDGIKIIEEANVFLKGCLPSHTTRNTASRAAKKGIYTTRYQREWTSIVSFAERARGH